MADTLYDSTWTLFMGSLEKKETEKKKKKEIEKRRFLARACLIITTEKSG